MRRTSFAGLFSALFALSLLVPLVAFSSITATEYIESNQIDVRLDGPSIIGIEQKAQFQLRITPEFAKERILNYSYNASIVGTNIFEATISPDNGTSKLGIFMIAITGPINIGDGELKVRINASAEELEVTHFQIKEFAFKVVKPVKVSATLSNTGEEDAENVTVTMYIDGDLKDEKVYDIPAGGTVEVSFNWTFASIETGKHEVTLIADVLDELVEFTEGNNILHDTIYYSPPGNAIRGIISVIIIFVCVVLILTILQKSGARPK